MPTRARARQRSLLRRLMLPLTITLAALVLGTGVSLVWQFKLHLDYVVNREITEIPMAFAAVLKKQTMALKAESRVIADGDEVRQAMRNRDRDRLTTTNLALFEQLRQEYGLTHFYFHTPERKNFLRLHLPQEHDSPIERFTFLEAERTGKVASGLELGGLGVFTLRVVQPIFEGNALLGYVELGKEIEDILEQLHTPAKVELALSIRKNLLDRQNWEKGMRMLNREANWDFLPEKVLIYSSLASFPSETASSIFDSSARYRDHKLALDTAGTTWRVAFLPSSDASGAEVGDIIVLHDISEKKRDFWRFLAMTIAGMVILLCSLLGFFHVVLTRTDRSILAREKEVRTSEKRYRLLFRNMSAGFALHEIILDETGTPCDYRFLEVNPAFEQLTGLKAEELLGRRILDILPGTEPYWIEIYGQVALSGKPLGHQNYSKELGKFYEVTAYAPQPGRFATIFTDITQQKEAAAVRRKLEEQLRQAQKMEAIGRLAGGVAHDFNNKLQIILGYTELTLDGLGTDELIRNNLEEIQTAARHSTALTRQLLAFARKQTIAPRLLDLNETIAEILKMLKRLLGEDIDLLWKPGNDLWPVKMDPVQVDQILANLTVNSRDAITGIGKITIETANTELDESYCAANAGFAPGQYVLLAIGDNGMGMDRETVANIFEPFFTTKPQGEGTGLGLATVYGIVKQNEGNINVYSEPEQGTIFKIYLPRAEAAEAISEEKMPAGPRPTGTETVLLVEDEEMLLAMAKTLLEKLGYSVIAAATPKEAIRRTEEHQGEIQLLLTDVIMPEMNGRELYHQLRALRPGLACLFMSGYTANVISHHGVLNEGIHFLQKPFSIEKLATMLRKALEG
jgi:two-component system, cell cycle sensor histidine kinase and response regulator CckA